MQLTLCLFILFGVLIGANCNSEYETEEESIGNGFCSFNEVWVLFGNFDQFPAIKSKACSTQVICFVWIHRKQVIEYQTVSYDDVETYMGRCRGAYFRRCLNYRDVKKTRSEPKMVEKIETIQKCCDGFTKHGDECLPFCSSNCNNGVCSAPNTCTCNSGYVLQPNSTHKYYYFP